MWNKATGCAHKWADNPVLCLLHTARNVLFRQGFSATNLLLVSQYRVGTLSERYFLVLTPLGRSLDIPTSVITWQPKTDELTSRRAERHQLPVFRSNCHYTSVAEPCNQSYSVFILWSTISIPTSWLCPASWVSYHKISKLFIETFRSFLISGLEFGRRMSQHVTR